MLKRVRRLVTNRRRVQHYMMEQKQCCDKPQQVIVAGQGVWELYQCENCGKHESKEVAFD